MGLECPEPVFRTRLMLDRMQPGEVLEICADDPLAELDLKVFCEQTGHALLLSQATESGVIVRIRRR
ncbi:MAG: sulfurtransferase TusA family protein [Xanthomonadaceae bacterium]|nr:sulfurtransferase TusA family protein [Xanthomonadaceae bacterium]